MASHNRRRSSFMFSYGPNAERGSFLQFIEESGSTALLIEAMHHLYHLSDKPDAPLEWLLNYFRKLAPKRKEYLDETKESLRRELMEIENSILVMREEERNKLARIDELCVHCTHRKREESSYPLPDLKEYQEKPQLRVDTRWRIAPHPLFRATCSEEEILLSDSKKNSDEKHRDEKDKTPEDALIAVYPENKDSILDEVEEDSHPEEEETDEEIHVSENFLDNASIPMLPKSMNTDEEESELEEEQDWIKNYDIYKNTSQIPLAKANSSRSARIVQKQKSTDSKTSSKTIPITTNQSSKSDIPVILPTSTEVLQNIHPDSLPPDYWKPGFTLNAHDEELGSSDESILEDELDHGYAFKDPENYYRPSHGPATYIKRPVRPDTIYEHYWQLWQMDLPGKTDILNHLKFEGIDEETNKKDGNECKNDMDTEKLIELNRNKASVPSVHVGNSVRNWFIN